MTSEILERANKLNKEIREIKFFIWKLERQPLKIIHERKKFLLNAVQFRGLDEELLECSGELKKEIIKTLENYLNKIEGEYEVLGGCRHDV